VIIPIVPPTSGKSILPSTCPSHRAARGERPRNTFNCCRICNYSQVGFVIACSGILFLVELFADKLPVFDLLWNMTGTAMAFTVNVATTARSSSLPGITRFTGRPTSFVLLGSTALGLFVVLLAVALFHRERRWSPAGIVLGMVVLSLVLASCGGCRGSSPPPPPTRTQAGTYPLTVTGTSGGTSRNMALTLTVQ
jgi:hypothetical protein